MKYLNFQMSQKSFIHLPTHVVCLCVQGHVIYEKLGSQWLPYSGFQGTYTLIVFRAFLDTDSCLSEVSVNSIAQVIAHVMEAHCYPWSFGLGLVIQSRVGEKEAGINTFIQQISCQLSNLSHDTAEIVKCAAKFQVKPAFTVFYRSFFQLYHLTQLPKPLIKIRVN